MGLAEPSRFHLVTDGRPEPVSAWMVTEGYFDALGVQPVLGRGFAPEEHDRDWPRAIEQLRRHRSW